MQHIETSQVLSREQLYEQVWHKPMRHLASEYGLSHVGLAKLCKRHEIPTPPVGYWAKLQHKKVVTQPALPTPSDPALTTIVIEPHVAMKGRPTTPLPEITVLGELASPHPLVALTARSLRKAKPDDQGLIRSWAPALPIAVSRETVDRALRTLDALVKALEARGRLVGIEEQDRAWCMTATVEGEPVAFALDEQVRREARPLTPREERDKEQNPWRYRQPLYRHLLTGRLRLRILTPSEGWCRRRWSDGDHQRLETCLASFIAQTEMIAAERQQERRRRDWTNDKPATTRGSRSASRSSSAFVRKKNVSRNSTRKWTPGIAANASGGTWRPHAKR